VLAQRGKLQLPASFSELETADTAYMWLINNYDHYEPVAWFLALSADRQPLAKQVRTASALCWRTSKKNLTFN